MTPSFVRTLLTGTIAGGAFLVLLMRVDWRRYGLLMGIALTLSMSLLRLPYPALWTPELALARESLLALLGALMGIQLIRHGWQTLASLLIVGAVGWMACRMPAGEHWGYRGLAFVCLASAMLLWSTWVEMDHHGAPLQRLAVNRMRYVLAMQAIYCGAWELGASMAGLAASAACAVNCWFMFGVARLALNGHSPSAPEQPAQSPGA